MPIDFQMLIDVTGHIRHQESPQAAETCVDKMCFWHCDCGQSAACRNASTNAGYAASSRARKQCARSQSPPCVIGAKYVKQIEKYKSTTVVTIAIGITMVIVIIVVTVIVIICVCVHVYTAFYDNMFPIAILVRIGQVSTRAAREQQDCVNPGTQGRWFPVCLGLAMGDAARFLFPLTADCGLATHRV